MPILLLRCVGLGSVLVLLTACIGAGAPEHQADRDEALAFREFRAGHVSIHKPSDGVAPGRAQDARNYFAHLENHVNVPANVETRMGSYTFFTSVTQAGRLIQVARDGRSVMAETIPRAFAMGDLQVACVRLGGREVLMLGAQAGASTNRHWFAMYRADGSRIYADSLDRPLVHVRHNGDGVSLFFQHGDSMRIRLTST